MKRFARLAGNGGIVARNGDSHPRARVRGDSRLAGDGGVISLHVRTHSSSFFTWSLSHAQVSLLTGLPVRRKRRYHLTESENVDRVSVHSSSVMFCPR